VAQDLNLDGRIDFAVASDQTDDVTAFLQIVPAGTPTPGTACPTGTSGFIGLTPLSLPGAPVALVADRLVNDDAIPDLATALSVAGADGEVALGVGRPTSGSDVVYQLARPLPVMGVAGHSDPSSLGAGDINRDGRLDLVVADRANNDVVIFLAATGGFTSALPPVAVRGLHPVALVMGDVDGDGRADVVTANADDGSVSFLITSQPPATPTPLPTGTSTRTGTPTPTATATSTDTPTVTPTPSSTPTPSRTRTVTSVPTAVPTATTKPGAITLQGSSCALDPQRRPPGGSTWMLTVLGAALALVGRRSRNRGAVP